MFSNFIKNVVNTVAPEVTAQRAPSHGFRVLKVKEGSPCASSGVESFYDFLVAVDGVHLTGDTQWLINYLKNAQQDITLSIWSVKGQVLRDVKVPPPTLTSMSLGVSLRWCPTHPTIENVYHVLDVAPNSPALKAGLRGHEDYIVGTPEGIVRGESGMGELIEDHLGKPLKLFVFNAYYNTTRQVVIVANKQWGGQGSMGCGIGFGALHRLPRPLTEPPEKPGQTMFEAPTNDTSSFLTGAQLSASLEVPVNTSASATTGGHSAPAKAKRKPNRMTAAEVEALVNEASMDSRPSSRTGREMPPPPKVTSPSAAETMQSIIPDDLSDHEEPVSDQAVEQVKKEPEGDQAVEKVETEVEAEPIPDKS